MQEILTVEQFREEGLKAGFDENQEEYFDKLLVEYEEHFGDLDVEAGKALEAKALKGHTRSVAKFKAWVEKKQELLDFIVNKKTIIKDKEIVVSDDKEIMDLLEIGDDIYFRARDRETGMCQIYKNDNELFFAEPGVDCYGLCQCSGGFVFEVLKKDLDTKKKEQLFINQDRKVVGPKIDAKKYQSPISIGDSLVFQIETISGWFFYDENGEIIEHPANGADKIVETYDFEDKLLCVASIHKKEKNLYLQGQKEPFMDEDLRILKHSINFDSDGFTYVGIKYEDTEFVASLFDNQGNEQEVARLFSQPDSVYCVAGQFVFLKELPNHCIEVIFDDGRKLLFDYIENIFEHKGKVYIEGRKTGSVSNVFDDNGNNVTNNQHEKISQFFYYENQVFMTLRPRIVDEKENETEVYVFSEDGEFVLKKKLSFDVDDIKEIDGAYHVLGLSGNKIIRMKLDL